MIYPIAVWPPGTEHRERIIRHPLYFDVAVQDPLNETVIAWSNGTLTTTDDPESMWDFWVQQEITSRS